MTAPPRIEARPAPTRPLSSRDMRHTNLAHLLELLREHRRLSRSDLARRTRLTVPTVYRLIAHLVALGLVEEDTRPDVTRGAGRRAAWYRFNSEAALAVGVDVGNETTRIALGAADGTRVARQTLATAEIADDLVGGLAARIRTLHHESGQPAPLVGAGVGISAVVNPRTGVITQAPLYHQWEGLPLVTDLTERLGCGVTAEQDDHLSALAELGNEAATPGAQSVVVLNVGKGIGVGCVVNGRLLRGVNGAAGRVARWPVNLLDGERLDSILVPDALVRSYRRAGGMGLVVDGRTLCDVARDGDPVARTIVGEVARVLGRVFESLAVTFDPAILVLGGGLAGSFDLFEGTIRECLVTAGVNVPVAASALGADAVVEGGLMAALQNLDTWLMEKIAA